jgi:hypothetical protein
LIVSLAFAGGTNQMTIQTVDPYLPHYIYEKMQDPTTPIVWRQYSKKMVDAVDHIVELSRGKRETIKTSEDWKILTELVNFWADFWPSEFKEFRSQIIDIRQSRARRDGYSAQKGKGGVRYLAAMPPRLMKLIKSIFPFQQFDRIFMDKLNKNIPIFKVGEKVDQTMI